MTGTGNQRGMIDNAHWYSFMGVVALVVFMLDFLLTSPDNPSRTSAPVCMFEPVSCMSYNPPTRGL